MKFKSIAITDSQEKFLKSESKRIDITESELLRRMLDEYIPIRIKQLAESKKVKK